MLAPCVPCEAVHSIMIKLALTIIQSAGQFIPNCRSGIACSHIIGSIMVSPSSARQAGALLAIWLTLCLMMLGL